MTTNLEDGMHPYICEGCTAAVPLTAAQYRREMARHRRILCNECGSDREQALVARKKQKRQRPAGVPRGREPRRPYICEGCTRARVQVTGAEYRIEVAEHGLLLCATCKVHRGRLLTVQEGPSR